MAINESNYEWLASGSSPAAQAAGASRYQLFGSFSGLSLYNTGQVVDIHLLASGADVNVIQTNDSKAPGIRVAQDQASYVSLRPMRVFDASQLMFENYTDNDNAVLRWSIWRRVG